jgi:hypothetical protein
MELQPNMIGHLLTEMLLAEQARKLLFTECISAVENFQLTMKDKDQYIAFTRSE